MKGSVDTNLLRPDGLAFYAGVCARALAAAHARGGDAVAITAYRLGRRLRWCDRGLLGVLRGSERGRSYPVNLSITNIGTIPHELLIFKSDLAPSAYPHDSKGDIIEDGPGITLVSDGKNIDPGGTQARAVDLAQPGTYLFVCNIPGHFKSGMFTTVIVARPSAAPVYVPASLNEWHVATMTTIKAGAVNLEAANFGTIQHELLIFKSDLAPAAYPRDSKGDIVEDGPGITLVSDGENIDPGGTQARTVDLSQPGTYLFVCNIPGHFKAGMFSAVTVTP